MSLSTAVRALASITKGALPSQTRCFASGALTQQQAVYLLQSKDDPDAEASLKQFCQDVFVNPGKFPSSQTDNLELTAKIEKKYVAAQIVEYGMQNISIPLSAHGSMTPVKRYAAQLLKLGEQAGFEEPHIEVEKRLAESAKSCSTMKEFLAKSQALMSPDYHAALSEALAQVEQESNASVTMDKSTPAYKAFTKKVQNIAEASGIPWKVLQQAKTSPSEESKKALESWAAAASVADAKAEVEGLKAEAVSLLDRHLAKTSEQIKKEQESNLNALMKKLEANKNTVWARKFYEDMKGISEFDAKMTAHAK